MDFFLKNFLIKTYRQHGEIFTSEQLLLAKGLIKLESSCKCDGST